MNERAADRVREALEEDVVLGRILPGNRLDEVALAARFGVSRTPVREALNRLAASGLVELRARRGAFVKAIGIAQVVEMFEVMAELEALCARLDARRISGKLTARLIQAHQACIDAAEQADADAYYHRNEAFHQTIYDACGNRFLAEQTEQLRNRLTPYRRMQLHVRNRIGGSLSEHRQIVDAIRAGEEDRVVEIVKDHILIQGEKFHSLVQGLDATPSVHAAGAS